MFLNKQVAISIISEAISNKNVLLVKYQHTTDGETVNHKIAPFDIGSTNPNPKIQNANAEKFYAYSFTHTNKDNQSDPKVCAFNINSFLEITRIDENFDETDLAIKNLSSTKYDYRNCKFALQPNRNWFQK